MSILIKGLDMPKECQKCPMFYQRLWYCQLEHRKVDDDSVRADWCPLIEVKTPHGELIDKRKMREYLLHTDLDLFWQGWGVLNEVNRQVPIIEAEE